MAGKSARASVQPRALLRAAAAAAVTAVAFMNTGGRQVQVSKQGKGVSTLSQKEGSPAGEAEMRPVHRDRSSPNPRRSVKVHAQPTTEKGQRVRTAVVRVGTST